MIEKSLDYHFVMNINIKLKKAILFFQSWVYSEVWITVVNSLEICVNVLSLGWISKTNFIYHVQEYLEEYVGTVKRRTVLYQVQYIK